MSNGRLSLLCAFVVAMSACGEQGTGECELGGDSIAAAVIGRDSPLAQLGKWDTDVLGLRNRDSLSWTDVSVTIYGFEVTNTKGKEPTGPYRAREVKDIAAGELEAYSLKDFENTKGGRWASLTMQAEELDVSATRGGRSCRATVSLSTNGNIR